MSQMYFVAADDMNGDSANFFVCANSAQEALDMWVVRHTKPSEEEDCHLRQSFYGNEVVRVWEAPATTEMGVVEWHECDLWSTISAIEPPVFA